jgi:hypothetical protein
LKQESNHEEKPLIEQNGVTVRSICPYMPCLFPQRRCFPKPSIPRADACVAFILGNIRPPNIQHRVFTEHRVRLCIVPSTSPIRNQSKQMQSKEVKVNSAQGDAREGIQHPVYLTLVMTCVVVDASLGVRDSHHGGDDGLHSLKRCRGGCRCICSCR